MANTTNYDSCIKYGLKLKYCGRSGSKTAGEMKTTLIYQGTLEACQKYFDTIQCGEVVDGYGSIENVQLYQDAGPFFNVEIIYSITINPDHSYSSSGSDYGPKSSTLNCRMMSMPLENRRNYKAKWNHYLFSRNGDKPGFWDTATSTELSVYERENYRWGQSSSECPEHWAEVGHPTKPGQETYDFPTYEITEGVKCSSQKQAGVALHYKAQRVCMPMNGDFGIKEKWGGEWLCIGGTINHDGKYWVAQIQYLYAPHGWDNDLYSDD